MGKTVDIECTAEIEIDEYVDEISDNVLLEEAAYRLGKASNQQAKRELLKLIMEDDDVIVDVISSSKNLSIIDAEKLREFITNLG